MSYKHTKIEREREREREREGIKGVKRMTERQTERLCGRGRIRKSRKK